jgi:hypothetical protein
MSNYWFGIDCISEKNAKDLHDRISEVNLYQDGLDVEDTRVSVISKQSLLLELENFARESKDQLDVEMWPAKQEYDEAEAKGSLETHSFDFKTKKKSDPKIKALKFKVYAGNSDAIKLVRAWLTNGQFEGLSVIGEWKPEVEFGSWGVEFTYDDTKITKLIQTQWLKKGVVCEKVR